MAAQIFSERTTTVIPYEGPSIMEKKNPRKAAVFFFFASATLARETFQKQRAVSRACIFAVGGSITLLKGKKRKLGRAMRTTGWIR